MLVTSAVVVVVVCWSVVMTPGSCVGVTVVGVVFDSVVVVGDVVSLLLSFDLSSLVYSTARTTTAAISRIITRRQRTMQ